MLCSELSLLCLDKQRYHFMCLIALVSVMQCVVAVLFGETKIPFWVLSCSLILIFYQPVILGVGWYGHLL